MLFIRSMSKIHKTEYHYLKMPFYFDIVCSDRRIYNIQMTFLYQYPAKMKGALRPSCLAEKPQTQRLHYFVTRSFLSYLNEWKKGDFPLEWQQYFYPKHKMPKERPFPYAKDETVKEYMSSLICGSFQAVLDRKSYQKNDIETERIRYLLAELNIVRWFFLIHDCELKNRMKHKLTEGVLRVYALKNSRLRN